MKLHNPRVVKEFKVEEISGSDAFLGYPPCHSEQMKYWFPLDTRWMDALRGKEKMHPSFTVQIVDYDISENPMRALDRRTAGKVLRKFGLVNPSTLQVLLMITGPSVKARQAIESLFDSYSHKTVPPRYGRTVVALTPMHPEEPTYFEFEARSLRVNRVEHAQHKDGTLYFLRGLDDRMDISRCGSPYIYFPFLMGIKPEASA